MAETGNWRIIEEPKVEWDPDTLMPVLPDGYFWRVVPGGIFEDRANVQLRKKRKFGSSRIRDRDAQSQYHSKTDQKTYDIDPVQSIQSAAATIWLAWKSTVPGAWASVYGDYPPKKAEAIYDAD